MQPIAALLRRGVAQEETHDPDPGDAAKRTLQLRAAPVRAQCRSCGQGRLHRRRRRDDLRRARAAIASGGDGAARVRRASRGPRAAADAGLQRLAGGLPRRVVRRGHPGRHQHDADGGRLRVHPGTQPVAGRAGVREPAGGPARSDGRLCARGRHGDRVATRRRHPRDAFRCVVRAARTDGSGRRHDGRRRGVVALLVGFDRPPERHRACAREPVLDGGAVRQAGPRADRGRRHVLRGQAVLRVRPRQRPDLPAVGRRDRDSDGGAPDARRLLRAHDAATSRPSSSARRPASRACSRRRRCRRASR